MNLLCPNCQQMLSVPDEFAGQLMKCSLCNGTFTVPGLPGSAPPPAAPDADVYSIRHDAPPPSPPVTPDFNLEPPAPAPSTATTKTPPSPPPSLAQEGYHRALTVWFSPRVLPWIAPVCLLLVFFLQFFDWVGLYPGGVPAVTETAWRAAFDLPVIDGDLPLEGMENAKPGVSVLTIFYLLLFFPTLVLTIASVVITRLQVKLPPQVEKILPWRWGIVAAINLILFLFLGLQVVLGFSLESHWTTWVEKQVKPDTKKTPSTKERKEAEVKEGELMAYLRHTNWLRFAVFLHVLAILSSALMFWIAQRGPHRAEPKLELLW